MAAKFLLIEQIKSPFPDLKNSEQDELAPSILIGNYYIDLRGEPFAQRKYEDLLATILNKRELPVRQHKQTFSH